MAITSAFVPKLAVNDWMSNPMTDTQRLAGSELRNDELLTQIGTLKDTNTKLQSDTSFFNSKDKMAGAAGLGSVLLQAVALPDQLKAARLQNRALQQNIDFAKEEQSRRNQNISGFNNVRPSQTTSAFARGGV